MDINEILENFLSPNTIPIGCSVASEEESEKWQEITKHYTKIYLDKKWKSLNQYLDESNFPDMSTSIDKIKKITEIIEQIKNKINDMPAELYEFYLFLKGNSQPIKITDDLNLKLYYDETMSTHSKYEKNQININLYDLLQEPKQVFHTLYEEIAHSLSIRFRPDILQKIESQYSYKYRQLADNIQEKLNKLTLKDPEFARQYNTLIIAQRKEIEEFDAVGAAIAYQIKNILANNPGEIALLLQWYKSGCDLNTIPSFISTYKHDLSIWKTKPTLWKRFLNRLYDILVN